MIFPIKLHVNLDDLVCKTTGDVGHRYLLRQALERWITPSGELRLLVTPDDCIVEEIGHAELTKPELHKVIDQTMPRTKRCWRPARLLKTN
jgi:nucleoside-triphosphatase THEP1